MKTVFLFAVIPLFLPVYFAHAESASVTIRAACDQNPGMGAANCPSGTRANPAPLCTDEPENSVDTFVERGLNCQTLGEALLGNERSCLDQRRVPASARIAASDLNRFVQRCDFIVQTPYRDIQDLTCVEQARARDAQINNTFQDLASRSVAQINCRLETINQYFTFRPPTNNPAPKARMIAAARAKFDQVKARVRGLIYSKQVLLERARARSFQNTRYCMGTGCGGPVVAGQREQAQIEANYEGAIAAEISKIPFGYEADVATAFVAMAQSGEFDENAFENALIGTFNKYSGLRSYYDQRATTNGNGTHYCIDSQFKEFAVSSGVMDQLLDAYPPNILNATTRDIVRCRLTSKYRTVGQRADTIMNGVFLVGAGAAAVLTAIPTAGGSLATYGAVAGIGLSVTSFAYQVQQANRVCRTRNFVVSPTGSEQCDAAQDFEKEVSQFSLSSCLAQSGFAALEAIPILPEVAALARSTRVVRTADEIADAATEAARSEARTARANPRPREETPNPRVTRDTPEPASAGAASGASGRRRTASRSSVADTDGSARASGRRSTTRSPSREPRPSPSTADNGSAGFSELSGGRSAAEMERSMQTSALRAVPGSRLPGFNGARLQQLEDGTRVVVKPVAVRHEGIDEMIRVGDYEMSASVVDRQLQLDAVPLMTTRTIEGRPVTVQIFAERAVAGGGARTNPDELMMFDYLIHNQDRYYTNYLNVGGRPVAIDNGFSFTDKTLTTLAPPDFPATVRGLVSDVRAGNSGSAAARERLQQILPNENTFERLRDTSPEQWREMLSPRLQPDEIAAFLQRRQQILDAVTSARSLSGTVMRPGRTPVRFTGPGEEVPDFMRSTVPPRTGP